MTVAQPVRGYLKPVRNASVLSRLAYNAEDGGRIEARPFIVALARDFLPRLEHKIIIRSALAYGRKHLPGGFWQEDVALLIALAAHDIELHAVRTPDDVTPAQIAQL